VPAVDSYPVMESFHTLQGEGFFVGQAAYFIRLAGCDVGCPWCDVKDSWATEGFPLKSASELAEEAGRHSSDIVVITGGEPCMYDLTALCQALHDNGKKVHLETSGAYPIHGEFDWICLSPKKFKVPIDEELRKADEFKVIVFNKSDFEWGLSFNDNLTSECIRLFQPEWSKRDKMSPLIVEYVKENPIWRISIQSHKYLDIP